MARSSSHWRSTRSALSCVRSRPRTSRPWPSACCTAFAIPITSANSPPALHAMGPELAISLSSDVMPDMREYERASTAVANAYVQPVVRSYLDRLADGLQRGRDRRRPDADRVGCRHHRARGGAALSGAPGRIGSRGRRARRIVPGPARGRARRDRVRRGRHDRQGLRHRRWRARARRRIRSGARAPLRERAAACR